MSNLRLTIFDIFSYISPGVCYLIIFYLWFINPSIPSVYDVIIEMNFNSSIAFLFIAYLTGFVMDSIAGKFVPFITDIFQKKFKDRVLDELSTKHVKEEIDVYNFSHIYAYIDIKAPDVRPHIDQYSALSGLSRNLSLATLFYIVSIWSPLQQEKNIFSISQSMAITLISLIVFITLVLAADKYRKWSHIHLLHIYSLLLKEDNTKSA